MKIMCIQRFQLAIKYPIHARFSAPTHTNQTITQNPEIIITIFNARNDTKPKSKNNKAVPNFGSETQNQSVGAKKMMG